MSIVITLRRTSRLSMRIVKNGDVHVSVPLHAPEADVYAFIERNKAWIEQARKKTAERQQTRKDFFAQLPLKTKEQWMDARDRLNAIVQPLLERHAKAMGVQPQTVFYRATISRWGCCFAGARSICFSLYLLLLPEWCIEHVVVHELVHLLVPNHGPDFYALMDRHFPRWREARAETRRVSRK